MLDRRLETPVVVENSRDVVEVEAEVAVVGEVEALDGVLPAVLDQPE